MNNDTGFVLWLTGLSGAGNSVTNFVEVHVAAPLETCAARDVEGLYAKAMAGVIETSPGSPTPTGHRRGRRWCRTPSARPWTSRRARCSPG
jgi:adenylylsulfate kinase-like enzyme